MKFFISYTFKLSELNEPFYEIQIKKVISENFGSFNMNHNF